MIHTDSARQSIMRIQDAVAERRVEGPEGGVRKADASMDGYLCELPIEWRRLEFLSPLPSSHAHTHITQRTYNCI